MNSSNSHIPKAPHLTWAGTLVLLETPPLLILAIMSVVLGRWISPQIAEWEGPYDLNAKEPFVAFLGLLIAMGAVGVLWCSRRHRERVALATGNLHVSDDYWRRYFKLLSALAAALWFLTLWQVAQWSQKGWEPAYPPRVMNQLDYRYLKGVDQRLSELATQLREGKVPNGRGDIAIRAKSPVTGVSTNEENATPKKIINDLREFVCSWTEEAYALAVTAQERQQVLRLLALQIAPTAQSGNRCEAWSMEESQELQQRLVEIKSQVQSLKQEHEAIAVRWNKESDPTQKSILANQVVAAEDRVNVEVNQQLRIQGRLEVLANSAIQTQGLNELIPWLKLPILSRGGAWRVLATWIGVLYLLVRLSFCLCVLVIGFFRSRVGSGQHAVLESPAAGRQLAWYWAAPFFWWLWLGW